MTFLVNSSFARSHSPLVTGELLIKALDSLSLSLCLSNFRIWINLSVAAVKQNGTCSIFCTQTIEFFRGIH